MKLQHKDKQIEFKGDITKHGQVATLIIQDATEGMENMILFNKANIHLEGQIINNYTVISTHLVGKVLTVKMKIQ